MSDKSKLVYEWRSKDGKLGCKFFFSPDLYESAGMQALAMVADVGDWSKKGRMIYMDEYRAFKATMMADIAERTGFVIGDALLVGDGSKAEVTLYAPGGKSFSFGAVTGPEMQAVIAEAIKRLK
jgi:hypothetical protein